jgi:glycosyltransferase involved in cell wall biosynthesis
LHFWIIQAQENPPAPRSQLVRREWRSNTLAERLADLGHDVVRWRSSFSHQAKTQLVEGSAKIATENYHHQYLGVPGYRSHVGIGRVMSHRALGNRFCSVAATYRSPPDLIHVGNVPIDLCYSAVKYGRDRNIPVVVDIRDLWPDSYADLLPDRFDSCKEPLRRWLSRRKGRLNKALAGATALTGLTQPYLDWGLAKAGRSQGPQDSVFSMGYPKPAAPPSQDDISKIIARIGIQGSDVLACYIGNIGHQSDFDGLIQSAEYLAASNPNLKFVIAGSGPQLERVRMLANDKANVIVPGWLQAPEVHALMHLSTFGLIAYRPVPNFLMNVPNKFAEYLAGGLVISCGLQGEMGRLVETYECGFVYDSGDPRALARYFANLLNQPDLLSKMARNSAALHQAKFDGDTVHGDFANYLLDIAQHRCAGNDRGRFVQKNF